ncbi:hypothetical protein [Luteolibacter marinus]|uniref:hypothetical protein n=1 Tax=Luteolibacter marinus TaxID=2776705 RepID=UPI001865DC5D|nr:hypothetical protein [Luteolibacter marinus]
MRRWKWLVWLAFAATIGLVTWTFLSTDQEKEPLRSSMPASPPPVQTPANPVPGDLLLAGYADPATAPIEDLRKIHRVVAGYFTVIKDGSRFPIGGNADLAAALRGENANREVFVRGDSPVFSGDGLLVDRWGSPLVVHPEAWRQLAIRSAGPDRRAYTADDLVLLPSGRQARPGE